MPINKNIIIAILVVVIVAAAIFFINSKGAPTFFPKLNELKRQNEILNLQLETEKKVTDSLLQATEVLTTEWDDRDTMMKQKIEIKYYEKVNNISTLDDDSTVLLLTDWLSEIDSLQR